MGTSSSVKELNSKLNAFANLVPEANKRATLAAAQVVKVAVLKRMAAASGGDLKLSGVGKSGAKIGVTYRVDGAVSANALVKATGPVQLIENRVRPHLVVPKGVKGGKRLARGAANRTGMGPRARAVDEGTAIYGKGAVLKIGDGFARYAAHPGVPVGKKPWAKGVKDAQPHTIKEFEKEYGRGMRKVFG